MRTVIGAHRDAGDFVVIEREGLEELTAVLRADGYKLVGPRVRDGAIVYDEITGAGELPVGWTDEQDGGMYRLHKRNDDAFFGYAVGPHSWKKFLFPPVVRLLEATRRGSDFEVKRSNDTAPKLAFIGVRACEFARHRDPGQGFYGWRICRSDLRGAAQEYVSRRGELRTSGGHVFLRFDEHRTSGNRWL
jgi:hypothetical protein